MRNQIPHNLISKVAERPEFLCVDYRQGKYDDLATTVKVMDATKSVIFDKNEIISLYGKTWEQNIRTAMKKREIKKLRIAKKDGKIYIWETKI